MEKEVKTKYVILSTLDISTKPLNYYFSEEVDEKGNKKNKVFTGRCSNEPQIKYLLDKYFVSKIIFIGTEEALVDKAIQNNPINNIAEYKFNIPKNEINNNKRYILHKLLLRLKDYLNGKTENSITDQTENLYPSTYVFGKSQNRDVPAEIIQADKDIDTYLTTLYSEIRQETEENCRVCLLIDEQGGQRSDRFVLNEILSLLRLDDEKITIEAIVANDFYPGSKHIKILNETDIRKRTQNLVSGTISLDKFGNVDELCEYYKVTKYSDNQRKLLEAMQDFNHAISLSDSDKIVSSAKKIKSGIRTCKKEASQIYGCGDPSFSVLLGNFEKTYSEFIFCRKDLLLIALIEWCYNKQFYQQALTLIREKTGELYQKKSDLFSKKFGVSFDVDDAAKYAKKLSPANELDEQEIRKRILEDFGEAVPDLKKVILKDVKVFCNPNSTDTDKVKAEKKAYSTKNDALCNMPKNYINEYKSKYIYDLLNTDEQKAFFSRTFYKTKNDNGSTVKEKAQKAFNLQYFYYNKNKKVDIIIYCLIAQILRNQVNHAGVSGVIGGYNDVSEATNQLKGFCKEKGIKISGRKDNRNIDNSFENVGKVLELFIESNKVFFGKQK